MDVWTIICLVTGALITGASLVYVPPRIRWWIRLWRLQHEPVLWQCWRCHQFYESKRRPAPLVLCNACLERLQNYLQEVA